MKFTYKHGFTLIELITTIAITGIFFSMAMNLYSNANKAYITDNTMSSTLNTTF